MMFEPVIKGGDVQVMQPTVVFLDIQLYCQASRWCCRSLREYRVVIFHLRFVVLTETRV